MSNEAIETTELDPEADPRRPTVTLTGYDGNAFSIMGRVGAALKKAGYTADERKEYSRQAMSGDYNNLLRVSMAWADVE